jgi:flagellum-specific peptidoglycan hydrolase FlgJ
MMRITILFMSLLFISATNGPIPKNVEMYIRKFLKIAQEEAIKYNIPVSIKLAQGLLESEIGESDLAKYNNNHFGIKCFTDCGKFVIKHDDTPTDKFRVFETPEESYRFHSQFLMKERYKHLTKLYRIEYRSWAHGLKKAGYATDPKYAQKLIKIIENYGLWIYDFNFLNW